MMGKKTEKKTDLQTRKELINELESTNSQYQTFKDNVTEKDNTSNAIIVHVKDNATTKKSKRKRKRHYFNAIREQMEFYFGDANLAKDRFLRKLIEEDPCVPLNTFLTFNKIKALTNNVEDIIKALKANELLEVDEKVRTVKRKNPLPGEQNVDDKTLYIEGLPPQADHDWVRRVFEKFGKVTYVSLPKYKQSRRIKEFGFVEYENENSIEKAIKTFAEFDAVLCTLTKDPAELTSIKAYIKEQKDEAQIETECRKRRVSEDFPQESDHVTNSKRPKLETTTTETSDLNSIEKNENEAILENKNDGGSKKKRRKKSNQSHTAAKMKFLGELSADVSYYELKILPKKDWKKLRNKYLNLQREAVRELKRKIWLDQQQMKDLQNEDSVQEGTQLSGSEHQLRKMNMNFYGANDEATQIDPKKEMSSVNKSPLFKYEPGLIVQISLFEPCVNIKVIKAEMRQYTAVKYVDIKEGAQQLYVRLETPDKALDFVKRIHCTEYQCKILTGEAESNYWNKIEKDREQKLNKQVVVRQKRGREKIKKLVSTHVFFNDENWDIVEEEDPTQNANEQE